MPYEPAPLPIPPLPPFDPVSIALDIVGFFLQLLGLGGPDLSVLSDAINNTWLNLVTSSAFLYNTLDFFFGFMKQLLHILIGGLLHILSDILHGHLKKVLEDIQKLLHSLHNLFAPLLAWLRKLQAIQRQMQLQSMRRLINLIQRARQVLLVFRLLHLKFATKLDNWLAGIEGRIITRELEIARKTNELIAWVNLVADPFGALRGTTVFGPIGRFLQALAGAARAADLDKVFPQLARHTGGTTPGVTWPQYAVDQHAQAAAGIGHYAAVSASASATLARLTSELDT